MFGPKGPVCQSCSMPLDKDPRGGSTNRDGTRNLDYCSNCFHAGKFIQPDMKLEEMQQIVRDRIKAMHFPGFIANRFVKRLGELKRWKPAGPASGPSRRPRSA